MIKVLLNSNSFRTALLSVGLCAFLASPNHVLAAETYTSNSNPAAVQQTEEIQGSVLTKAGDAVVGASVYEKANPTNGTITDVKGQFSLSVGKDAVVVVSFIGYKTQEVNIASQTKLTVVLEADTQALDEVVVVGYGTTKKRDLIASVSTVDTESLNNSPIVNLSQGLAGRAPGLIVRASGGGIDNRPAISIRGCGEPLYVIDGVIRSQNDFMSLSPEEVESMSILKDASATAVYGARAANGIVQVTTKRGQAGKISVEYDFNVSLAQPSMWQQQFGSLDRAKWANIAYANDGKEPKYPEEVMQKIADGSDPLNFSNTNWRKLMLRDWSTQTKHSVRMSGGNDRHHFFASISHVDQNSAYRSNNHWMKRTNFRLAETAKLKKLGITLNATLDGWRQHNTHPLTTENVNSDIVFQVFYMLQTKTPFTPAYNKHGLLYNTNYSPLVNTAKDAGYHDVIQNVMNGKGEIVWDLPWVKGLRFRAATSYQYFSSTTKQWRKDPAVYDWDSQQAKYFDKPKFYKDFSSGYLFTNQVFAEYANTFGKHSISALLGYEESYNSNESYWVSREKYPFFVDQISAGDANTQKNDGWEAESGRKAVIAQLKYNYANKYYVETSMRRDASDLFAPGKRWGTFFSGSLAWVVTGESFMKSLVEKNILNMLKFRLSYGETGMDSGVGRFAYLTSYDYTAKGAVIDGAYSPYFSEGALPSPDLTWFTTKSFDFGFDFSSLNNRLYGSFDYFFNKTKGYLVAPVGDSFLNHAIGIALPKVKSDTDYRHAGWEFQLGWRDKIGDFSYDIQANYTHFVTMWGRIADEAETSAKNPFLRAQGQKLNYYDRMYKSGGLYQSADEVYNSVTIPSVISTGNLTPGDVRYIDANGDGQIDGNDYRRTGNYGIPRGQYGINIALQYKGFYMNALFQGATSYDLYIPGEAALQSSTVTGDMPLMYAFQRDHWRPDNRNSRLPRLTTNTGANLNNNYQYSDYWLVDGGYLRLKDFQFGYDFKRSVLKNVKWLSKAKFGISGMNLFTISKAKKYGIDPETRNAQNASYPVERIIAFTLNLGF